MNKAWVSLNFAFQEALRKDLHDTCAVVQSLKEDIDHLNEETQPRKEDVAILERTRCVSCFVHAYLLWVSVTQCHPFTQILTKLLCL
jgi:hypothetical protein